MAENIDSVTQFRIGAAISTRKKARALDDDAAQQHKSPMHGLAIVFQLIDVAFSFAANTLQHC